MPFSAVTDLGSIATGIGSASDVTLPITADIAVGDLVVVAIELPGIPTIATVTTVTDSSGNTYVHVKSKRHSSGDNRYISQWACLGAGTAVTVAGGGTITATGSAATTSFKRLTALRVSTGGNTVTIDTGACPSNEGALTAAWDAGATGTRADPNELVVVHGIGRGFFAGGSPGNTPTTGYTETYNQYTSNIETVVEYEIYTADASTVSPGGTWADASYTWWMALAGAYILGSAIEEGLTPASTLDQAQPLAAWPGLTSATTTDAAQPLSARPDLDPATTIDAAQPLGGMVRFARAAVQGEPRPDVALYAELENAEGRAYRLDPDDLEAANRSTAIKFGTRLMEGYTSGSVSVARDIRKHWGDLQLNGTLRFVGEAARVAYEGRLSRFPASNAEGHRIGLEAVGWLTHARDRKRIYDPTGLRADEAIVDSAGLFCPLLNTEGVIASSTLVTHEPWDELTDPLDMWLELNAAELRQLAVWENRALVWEPLQLDRTDWVIRLDEGAKVDFEGPSIERLATGVQVEFEDSATSLPTIITPEDTPTLAVTDPDVLATLDGLDIVPTITLTRPNTVAGAERIGIAVLSDLIRPKHPCRATVRAHIRDRSGNWQQAWVPHAGQMVVIEDYDSSPPRLIHETSYDHETLTLTMDLDADAKTIDALIAQAGG